MRIDIITIFPQMFSSFLETSLIARGIKKEILDLQVFDLRNVTTDAHKTVDDRPFGGGPGMVLKVDIIDKAIQQVLAQSNIPRQETCVILLTPQGVTHNQSQALALSQFKRLIFICGHYEGFDERIRDLVDLELSAGDYVLTGGELAAMLVVDSVARLVPDFLGKEASHVEESFQKLDGKILLEYPHYTKPLSYKGKTVPNILLSGHHGKIKEWRYNQALAKTKKRRPDLLEKSDNQD